ncbi:MAG TPA: hypothetical protein VMH27_07980 [Puia sp.]|nr:hypothetical protein [Puia sp.]
MNRYCCDSLTWFIGGAFCSLFSFCQKVNTAPNVSGVASFTVMNAIPNSSSVIPVLNTSSEITWFGSARSVYYGYSSEYSPPSGDDTVYVVQDSDDTLGINPKSPDILYYGILPLKKGGTYSLFLCGSDTSSPDFLFASDSVPYYIETDSVVGIRFVNLSATAGDISINLEGNPIGSEIADLPYKGITQFKSYASNSTTQEYIFVIHDAVTGDSLTEFDFNGGNSGYGLYDPITYNLLTFRSATVVVFGSATNSNFPLATTLIDNFF